MAASAGRLPDILSPPCRLNETDAMWLADARSAKRRHICGKTVDTYDDTSPLKSDLVAKIPDMNAAFKI